jgi:phosphatidylinositol glycan class V
LKYWTLSNAPLFLIASPVLYALLSSAWRAVNGSTNIKVAPSSTAKKNSTKTASELKEQIQLEALLFRLALPQLALASAALTSFHVQVITRLSSGYPLWYLVLAQDIMDNRRIAQWLVRWNVMYAIIQTPLYAYFLPPA